MATTDQKLDKYCVQPEAESGCENEWCDGPKSETLPCFECFDPDREYESGLASSDAESQEGA